VRCFPEDTVASDLGLQLQAQTSAATDSVSARLGRSHRCHQDSERFIGFNVIGLEGPRHCMVWRAGGGRAVTVLPWPARAAAAASLRALRQGPGSH